jgi:ribonuclease D
MPDDATESDLPDLPLPDIPLLSEPAEGTPEPVTTQDQLRRVIDGVAAGRGPVAVDAERASGYRYSQRAYLVQLRREGFGTTLIDPIALPDLSELNAALDGVEWILHAAHQDLPCLAEVGLHPGALFDTELAGRLLGEERVALGTMVESRLGVRLEKGHSAADWSTRPLPYDWLVYAALDVELLIALRAALTRELADAGKSDWAAQEFEFSRQAGPSAPRTDPWRRTSGIHAIRDRRQLAVVRALWVSRDELATERDVAPGRLLPDASIIAAARKSPADVGELTALPVFGGPRQRRNAQRWFSALQQARELTDRELPPLTLSAPDAVPPASRWRDRAPEAADRLAACRAVVTGLAEQHQVLAQNLVPGDLVRRLAWAPPAELTTGGVDAALAELGARAWQRAICAEPLASALAEVRAGLIAAAAAQDGADSVSAAQSAADGNVVT